MKVHKHRELPTNSYYLSLSTTYMTVQVQYLFTIISVDTERKYFYPYYAAGAFWSVSLDPGEDFRIYHSCVEKSTVPKYETS